jgi:hypothetical protein
VKSQILTRRFSAALNRAAAIPGTKQPVASGIKLPSIVQIAM